MGRVNIKNKLTVWTFKRVLERIGLSKTLPRLFVCLVLSHQTAIVDRNSWVLSGANETVLGFNNCVKSCKVLWSSTIHFPVPANTKSRAAVHHVTHPFSFLLSGVPHPLLLPSFPTSPHAVNSLRASYQLEKKKTRNWLVWLKTKGGI